ncbi:DUF1835 domain-containing protein [Caballeronia telluris]|uniref:DUF1835 domain-containing protein n=1 Tax=Caballeronia telluris TaxID=326475 RepID=A0A158J2T1_9BURK|nr:DUF1835 domain-containing protein [Caballeronia telluris]SAL63166.1 hypothetical protein AWB66_03735 [Caballeronia telluris]
MSIIHVTNGDHAADTLREALKLAGRDEPVVALKDDLAVGPIRNVDDAPDTRATFWRHVLAGDGIDFDAEFEQQETQLQGLVRNDAQIVVWHGQSASDQLTLRRVAYHLRNAPQRLNEAKLSDRDLPFVTDADGQERRRGRSDGATAVGMFSAEEMLAKLPSAAPISVLRIGRLALEWQEAKHVNAQTRRWQDNTFVAGTYAEIDQAILELVTPDWQPARRIAGQVMSAEFGFMVSDSIAFWRCRELAMAGRLKLRGEPGDIVNADLRQSAGNSD